MTHQRPWNLFALVDDPDQPVRRLPLSRDVQLEVRTIFEAQLSELVPEDVEEVPFDPGFKPDESEVFYIPEFELPGALWGALENPLAFEDLTLDDNLLETTKGFFTGDSTDRRMLFQVFDRRRLLSPRGFTLVLMDNTFRKLEHTGATLDNKLTAAYQEGRLYFRSFHQARRLFDLSLHFAEATDDDLRRFVQHGALSVAEPEEFVAEADTWTRKHIALIVNSGILDTTTPQDVVEVAGRYRLAVRFDESGKLVLPAERKAMKNLLRLLNDSYFTSDLSGQQYLSNSKRPVR